MWDSEKSLGDYDREQRQIQASTHLGIGAKVKVNGVDEVTITMTLRDSFGVTFRDQKSQEYAFLEPFQYQDENGLVQPLQVVKQFQYGKLQELGVDKNSITPQTVIYKPMMLDWGDEGIYFGIITDYDSNHTKYLIEYPFDEDSEWGVFNKDFSNLKVDSDTIRVTKWIQMNIHDLVFHKNFKPPQSPVSNPHSSQPQFQQQQLQPQQQKQMQWQKYQQAVKNSQNQQVKVKKQGSGELSKEQVKNDYGRGTLQGLGSGQQKKQQQQSGQDKLQQQQVQMTQSKQLEHVQNPEVTTPPPVQKLNGICSSFLLQKFDCQSPKAETIKNVDNLRISKISPSNSAYIKLGQNSNKEPRKNDIYSLIIKKSVTTEIEEEEEEKQQQRQIQPQQKQQQGPNKVGCKIETKKQEEKEDVKDVKQNEEKCNYLNQNETMQITKLSNIKLESQKQKDPDSNIQKSREQLVQTVRNQEVSQNVKQQVAQQVMKMEVDQIGNRRIEKIEVSDKMIQQVDQQLQEHKKSVHQNNVSSKQQVHEDKVDDQKMEVPHTKEQAKCNNDSDTLSIQRSQHLQSSNTQNKPTTQVSALKEVFHTKPIRKSHPKLIEQDVTKGTSKDEKIQEKSGAQVEQKSGLNSLINMVEKAKKQEINILDQFAEQLACIQGSKESILSTTKTAIRACKHDMTSQVLGVVLQKLQQSDLKDSRKRVNLLYLIDSIFQNCQNYPVVYTAFKDDMEKQMKKVISLVGIDRYSIEKMQKCLGLWLKKGHCTSEIITQAFQQIEQITQKLFGVRDVRNVQKMIKQFRVPTWGGWDTFLCLSDPYGSMSNVNPQQFQIAQEIHFSFGKWPECEDGFYNLQENISMPRSCFGFRDNSLDLEPKPGKSRVSKVPICSSKLSPWHSMTREQVKKNDGLVQAIKQRKISSNQSSLIFPNHQNIVSEVQNISGENVVNVVAPVQKVDAHFGDNVQNVVSAFQRQDKAVVDNMDVHNMGAIGEYVPPVQDATKLQQNLLVNEANVPPHLCRIIQQDKEPNKIHIMEPLQKNLEKMQAACAENFNRIETQDQQFQLQVNVGTQNNAEQQMDIDAEQNHVIQALNMQRVQIPEEPKNWKKVSNQNMEASVSSRQAKLHVVQQYQAEQKQQSAGKAASLNQSMQAVPQPIVCVSPSLQDGYPAFLQSPGQSDDMQVDIESPQVQSSVQHREHQPPPPFEPPILTPFYPPLPKEPPPPPPTRGAFPPRPSGVSPPPPPKDTPAPQPSSGETPFLQVFGDAPPRPPGVPPPPPQSPPPPPPLDMDGGTAPPPPPSKHSHYHKKKSKKRKRG